MFIKGIAIFLQFILLQSANEIKENKRATLFTFGSPPYLYITVSIVTSCGSVGIDSTICSR